MRAVLGSLHVTRLYGAGAVVGAVCSANWFRGELHATLPNGGVVRFNGVRNWRVAECRSTA